MLQLLLVRTTGCCWFYVSINKRETDNHIIKQPWADCNKPLPFRKHGVRLDYYQEFIAACGGRDSLKGLTTTEVNENFVKPATAHFQSSYCDMLSSQRHAAVGLLATVFTSHAWKYLFLDVIDALLYHFQDEPGIVVWFDLFSNNQHKAVDLDFHWWCNTLKTAIEQFGHTVMVLSPWQDPIPLTRAYLNCIAPRIPTVNLKWR